MYSVTVQATFSAIHRLRLSDGSHEPVHGHDWIVQATFSRASLDDAGMVVDFHDAHCALGEIVSALHHTDLNEVGPLCGSNPTAEVVARHIFDRLAGSGLGSIRRVSVVEAPGCVAAYEAASEVYVPGGD